MTIPDNQMPRSEVLLAALLMEAKLRQHDGDRGPKGWKNDHPLHLFARVKEEVCEVQAVLDDDDPNAMPGGPHRDKFIGELVDVMNFCMMTLDQLGGLDAVNLDLGLGEVPFTKADVTDSLDRLIRHWRLAKAQAVDGHHGSMIEMATHYLDAYQSVRINLFGEELAE